MSSQISGRGAPGCTYLWLAANRYGRWSGWAP